MAVRTILRSVGTLLGAAALVVASSVSVGALAGGKAKPVVETEYAIKGLPTHLSPGVHKFVLVNKGRVAHELVIFKTDVDAKALPLEKTGDVNEEASELVNVADSGSPLKKGKSRTVTTKYMAPGHYVAICNLTGHYEQGMRINITVS